VAVLRDGVMQRGKTWSYVIRVIDPSTGRSKPKWVGGFRTEGAAKAARDEARVRARRGEYVDRNRITVGQYLDQWLDAHAMEIKPKTLLGYRSNVRLYVKPHIGSMRLQAVRPSTLSALYQQLLESGGRGGRPLSARSVEYVHAVLRKALRDAVVVDELLPSNPADRAKCPHPPAREPEAVWTSAQLRSFLSVAAGHPMYAFFRLAAYTGARRGELLNLTWFDIDLPGREVRFAGSTNVIDGRRIVGTTKSGHKRVVAIDDGTAEILRAHRMRQQARPPDLVGDGHVFTSGFGEELHPDTVSGLMTRLITEHNTQAETEDTMSPLPHARLHDLRHLHATTLLLAGVPVHVVAARLGHRDPAVTLRVYAHLVRERAPEVASVLAAALDA
jgi:integrase